MAPKRQSSASANRAPAKRSRGIGAASMADDTSRLVAAHHAAEHAGQGRSYLSLRDGSASFGRVRSLVDISLRVSAEGILQTLRVPERDPALPPSAVGWNESRQDELSHEERHQLRDYIKELPTALANRILDLVLQLSVVPLGISDDKAPAVSILALASLFLHSGTTELSLSSLSAPSLLLNRIPNCTALEKLDLSGHTNLRDAIVAKIFSSLPTLSRVNLRGSTKVGDLSVVALSETSNERLLEVNLSLTAVSLKGLTALFSRCSRLAVLKLANVNGLGEKAISKLVDDATAAALPYHHVPLSNLRILKLRSTELTDSSMGRLLSLCSLTLTRLDISYTNVRTLDILSRALHTVPEWRLEKLVVSGLPLSLPSMIGFFKPLSERPSLEERKRFKTLKLGAITTTSSAKAPGLTDGVFEKVLPYLEKIEGLENITLFQNWGLGKRAEPMCRFFKKLGRRCKYLDLSIYLESYHLDGLYPLVNEDTGEPLEEGWEPPRIETLVLDSSHIDDTASGAIKCCPNLSALHLAETKISCAGLLDIMSGCPHLATLNLTSCRGVPVAQRRNFFDAFEKGEIVVDA